MHWRMWIHNYALLYNNVTLFSNTETILDNFVSIAIRDEDIFKIHVLSFKVCSSLNTWSLIVHKGREQLYTSHSIIGLACAEWWKYGVSRSLQYFWHRSHSTGQYHFIDHTQMLIFSWLRFRIHRWPHPGKHWGEVCSTTYWNRYDMIFAG